MFNYHLILEINYSDKQWSMNGDNYDGLTWLDFSPKPTQAELDALWESTQTTITEQNAQTQATKASALAKLTALGLSQDEVKCLLGL